MFYRRLMTSCLLGLLTTVPCFASPRVTPSPALRLAKVLPTEIVKAKLPYAEKIAVSNLSETLLEKYNSIIAPLFANLSFIDVFTSMEKIKTQVDDEMYELNSFAAKFFSAMIKSEDSHNMAALTSYIELVDDHKHLLSSSKYFNKLDELVADVRDVADLPTYEQEAAITSKYTEYVLEAFKEAGAIDFFSIHLEEEALMTTELENTALADYMNEEHVPFLLPIKALVHLVKQRAEDLSTGEDGFKVLASDYGLAQEEIDSLQQLIDFENNSGVIMLDYFADNITKEEFVSKMDNLLATHGEALDTTSKSEISKQIHSLLP